MGDAFTVGQRVMVFSHGTPSGVTEIAKVKMRLGKVTGYETADGRDWNRMGSAPGKWNAMHIGPTSAKDEERLRAERAAGYLGGMSAYDWRAMPTDLLLSTWAAVKAARKGAEQTSAKDVGHG